MNDAPPMTVDELAAYLRVSKHTVYEWRRTGVGPLGCRVGKHLRYRHSDVEAWLEERASRI